MEGCAEGVENRGCVDKFHKCEEEKVRDHRREVVAFVEQGVTKVSKKDKLRKKLKRGMSKKSVSPDNILMDVQMFSLIKQTKNLPIG